MKYIIEIKPEYEDSFKGLMILGAKDSNLFVDMLAVEDLEELNSDYINEHFGDLQDTAYQKGINDGSLDVKQRVEGAYQKGFEDGKAVHDKGCEGCLLQGTGSNICGQCCNSYANQWMARDEKIEVGDEVIFNNTMKCLVVKPESEESYASLIDSNGNHHSAENCDFKKTGRHFDIESILEAMKHD